MNAERRVGLPTTAIGLGNNSGNPREISLPESLTDILEGKKLTPEEARAAQAADMLIGPLMEKRIVFGAYVFRQRGIFRARELIGTSPNQAVNMRDRVVTDKKYVSIWDRFSALQRPNFLEVASYKKQKKKHSEIALILGISKHEVDEISKHLIAAGAIQPSPRGRGQAERFRRIVERVEILDDSGSDQLRPTQKELSESLGISESRVKRARRARRIQNEAERVSASQAKKPNSEGVASRRGKVGEGIKRGLTNRQISVEYVIPFGNVRDDRAWLRENKKVKKVSYSKAENKEKLRVKVDEHLAIKLEQEVPPLR